ncbi:MAG: hypothetical protein IT373_16620 [Polyangiaceae bacterium]|nr:hypothetical protein [Polyangiaceae bacterium]
MSPSSLARPLRLTAPWPLALAAVAAVTGCGGVAPVPPAEPVVVAYEDALRRGDADALYELMSAESKRAVSREELLRVLTEQKEELADHVKGIASPERVVQAHAEVRYGDGEIVSLALEGGGFRVGAVDALPAAARTPVQALAELRRSLARRSYPALLRLLSPRTRSAIESDLRSLVDGLAEPDALRVEVTGDQATVHLPGHVVVLRREDGVWYVDDFD